MTDANWLSAKREALERRTNIVTLFGLAWKLFTAMPASRRERVVRESESKKRKGAAA